MDKSKSKRERVLGRDFMLFLKDHGYIDDCKVQSITITAYYDDVTTITVNKHMTKEGDDNE